MSTAKNLLPSLILLSLLLICSTGFAQDDKDPVDYVNPYIGSISPKTGGTSPTVYLPHSHLSISPQFTPGVGDRYVANKIFGFPIRGTVLMPTVGDISNNYFENASTFDHDFETSTPYYYQVLLEDTDINTEFSVTENCVFFRFTFPSSEKSNVLFNMRRNGLINIVDDKTVEGQGFISYYNGVFGRTGRDDVRFHAEFSKPFKTNGTWKDGKIDIENNSQEGDRIGGFVSFETGDEEVVLVKIGTSLNSLEEAKANLAAQIPDWDFNKVKAAGKEIWNESLNRIKITGGNEEQRTIFYSSLYRTMGWKGNVWDTYRSAYPLQVIIEPGETKRVINSFVEDYEKDGWMPSSGAMIGNHTAAFIADSYLKGITDFDVEKAYEGLRKNATEATMIPWRDGGHLTELEECYFEKGFYPALPVKEDDKNKYGGDPEAYSRIAGSEMPYQITWLPEVGVKEWVTEVDGWHRRQSVSVTLEHAYDDWCLAQFAKVLGKTDDYELFMKRADNYKNLFDPSIGLMAPKSADGEWVRPFDPKLDGGFAGEGYFAEGNSWIMSWSVQHDIQGLINLMGGRDKFTAKLDQLFREQYQFDKPAFIGQFPDMTGLIGMYCHGNEPSFHIPYLYNYIGKPWETQKKVRQIMDLWYTDTPFGLSGDDDGGSLTSWYVFSSMGFYPVTPGTPTYVLGSPIFEKSVMNVGNGNTFTVEAKNVSVKNKYIQSAVLNGKPLNKLWFEHKEIVNGGSLILQMGPRPNKKLGISVESAPPSMSKPE